MLEFSETDADQIYAAGSEGKAESNLGYFSKPFRVNLRNKDYIIKKYQPVRNSRIVNFIIENHGKYIEILCQAGIKIPDTFIGTFRLKGGYQIYIIQEAFHKQELLRYRCEISSERELLNLSTMIFNDTMKFMAFRTVAPAIGFHPTLRNYALHKGTLIYFDTFPPMLMEQDKLNKIILKMSPFGSFLKELVPPRSINIVSDEYYKFPKMFTGIAGSLCRLRPEFAPAILSFAINYIINSGCPQEEAEQICDALKSPPALPPVWTIVRKLSGNEGKSNIRRI